MLSVLFVALMVLGTVTAKAQESHGMSGLMNIPTAENVEDAKFNFGVNYLAKEMLPPYFTNQYNSMNYYATVNMFSFLEFGYRMTLLKGENGKMNQQDRSISLKLHLLRESKYCPGIAIGTSDPFVDQGVTAYEAYYGVVTKGVDLGGNRLSATVGYYLPYQQKKNKEWKIKNKGVFAGLSFSPSFCRDLKIMAEYDSQKCNAGASVLLWKHISVHAFAYDMKHLSAGIGYEYVIKH